MTSTFYLSRASLRRDPSVATLAPILFEAAGRHRSEASRRLVWTLFADDPTRTRDFLWREDAQRRFYMLSTRPPQDRHQLFHLETKAFAPELSAGDRLQFRLRANATIARARGAGERAGSRDDVVMAALTSVPKAERAQRRPQLVVPEGRAWLRRQGKAHGFTFKEDQVNVEGYEPTRIRGRGKAALDLAVMDFEGILSVCDPAVFLNKIACGFGRGKAFGLGLMLVRRAPRPERGGA